MNIVVLLKQTFDTEERIRIAEGKILEEGIQYIINPYDEYALEEALRIKAEAGGYVTVLSVGPPRTEHALRTALALGADQAALIEVREEEEWDGGSIAQLICAGLKKIFAEAGEVDLILGGYMAVDTGAGQVALRVAEELGWAHVSAILKITFQGQEVILERDVEGDLELIQTHLPLLVTAQQGLNEPRYPSLRGIMQAKKKSIRRFRASELGLFPPKTKVVEYDLPAPKERGTILRGDLDEQVAELLTLLQQEQKLLTLE